MFLRRKCSILLLTTIFVLLFAVKILSLPADVRGHWAEEYIDSMMESGLMSPRADGYFRPDTVIDRSDLLALVTLKEIPPAATEGIPDLVSLPRGPQLAALVKEGYIALFPDNTLRPENIISRGEMATILLRYLELNDQQHLINTRELSAPSDLPSDHWALEAVKIISRLGLISPYPDGSFRPAQGLTRGEFARTVYLLQQMTPFHSYVQEVYPVSGRIALETLDNRREIITLGENVLLGRNNRLAEVKDLMRQDRIYLILDNNGEAIYAKAYGLLTQSDLATEISHLTQNFLTPEDVSHLMQGEYEVLSPKLAEEAEKQLLQQGLNEHEINALLQRDWDSLEDLGKIRLSEIISIETGLPLDMTRALINQDWAVLEELTKLELIQRVLQGVLSLEIFNTR